jgi:hypothetical protein
MGGFGFILFIRAINTQHWPKNPKIEPVQSSPDGFITHQLKSFLNQMFGQVKTSPHRKRFPGIPWILIDRILQRFFTFAIYFWGDAHYEGDPPVPLDFLPHTDQTSTTPCLHRKMSVGLSLLHYVPGSIAGSFDNESVNPHSRSDGIAFEAFQALLRSVFGCSLSQAFFPSIVDSACNSKPDQSFPKYLCGFI